MKPTSTSQHTPGVDYQATSERIHYEDLSPAVRGAADVALGSSVVWLHHRSPPGSRGRMPDASPSAMVAGLPMVELRGSPGACRLRERGDRAVLDPGRRGSRAGTGAPTLLVGDHLNHFDLRPDNLLIGRGRAEKNHRAYVLDWNWVTLGPAWCDWVGLIPTIHDQGYTLADLLASSPLSRDADPDAVESFLAVVAVYMLRGLDSPTRPQPLLDHTRYTARIFLNSLATHRGWL